MRTIGRFFVSVLVLPLYKLYLGVKKIATKFYAPQLIRHKLIHPFSRRYLIHIAFIVISLFTLTANLNAYETRREDFRQASVVSKIVTIEDLGLIEEEGPINVPKKVTRYLGQTGVESKPQVSEGGEDILPSTTAGGSAVVRPILSPIEEGLRLRDEIIYYTVQPGDTISEIAAQFGITSNTILWENNLTAYNIIRPGDKLAILPNSGIRHTVVKGDTLNSIAKKYSVEVDKIMETNKIASVDDLQIGERLIIPGGKKPVVPTPSYAVRSFYEPTPVHKVVSGSGEMTWPSSCRRITQYFGWRHSGIDVACGYGKPVYAADDGQIIKATGGWNGGYGTVIVIDHGNGIQTLYGHLSKLYVTVGESVEKGQNIAAEGSTGRSTGAHLHFEIRAGGVRKNPFNYVQ